MAVEDVAVGQAILEKFQNKMKWKHFSYFIKKSTKNSKTCKTKLEYQKLNKTHIKNVALD